MRKTLLILCLISFCSTLIVDAATYSGVCGPNLTWYLDTNTKTLTINGYGEMYDYEYDGGNIGTTAPWAPYRLDIQVVKLPSGLTSIGKRAFYLCDYLERINIPSSVTTIKYWAFFECGSLISVHIPRNVTNITKDAFKNVPNVMYYGASKELGSRCVNGYVEGYIVYRDESKSRIIACSWAAKGVITLPESVFDISEEAFKYCTNITSVIIPNDTRYIGRDAFMLVPNIIYYGKLKGATDSWHWGSKSINGYVEGNFVYENENKTKLLACIGNIVGSAQIPYSVKKIRKWAFLKCWKLTSIYIPSSVISICDEEETIPARAFEKCHTIYYSGSATGSPWGAGRVVR